MTTHQVIAQASNENGTTAANNKSEVDPREHSRLDSADQLPGPSRWNQQDEEGSPQESENEFPTKEM